MILEVLIAFAVSILSLYLFPLFFRPLTRVQLLKDADIYKGGRLYSSVPPVFPNGWYKILDSFHLKRKQVKYIQAIGQHFAVFRGENGKVSIVDAYCPHLGANMGLHGKVTNNCLECPFHGWRFDQSGKCTKIPYTEAPDFAKVRTWPVVEVNNIIFVYYDAEGREPTWFPPLREKVESGSWSFHGRTEHHVRAHIQEIPENGADVAHLGYLHKPFIWMGCLLKHSWNASWEASTEADHIANVKIEEVFMFLDRYQVPFSRQLAVITQIGPGIVYLEFDTIVGKLIAFETVTPIGPLHQQTDHTIYAEFKVPRFIAKFLLYIMAVQFEKDVPIWSNKTFLNHPMVVKGDGPIPQFRRWYSKFYSKNSPTLESVIKQQAVFDW